MSGRHNSHCQRSKMLLYFSFTENILLIYNEEDLHPHYKEICLVFNFNTQTVLNLKLIMHESDARIQLQKSQKLSKAMSEEI